MIGLKNIKLELTFGCDNKCPMCYKQVLYKSDFDFMNIDTAECIIKLLKESGLTNCNIQFSMRGEPLLNPYWSKIVSLFRDELPDAPIFLTTNGNNLTRDNVIKFFNCGGNILLVDCYNNNLLERKSYFQEFDIELFYEDAVNIYRYTNILNLNKIILIDSILNKNNTHPNRKLLNQGGNVDFNKTKKLGIKPLKEPLKLSCNRPFRDLVILYNGDIVLCCEDANIDQKLENVKLITNLKSFWNNFEKLNKIRNKLANSQRIFKPCKYCDYKGD